MEIHTRWEQKKTVLKAIWKLNVFSLTVDVNGGTIIQEFKSEYAVGETIELTIPTKTGYAFTGWTATNGSVDNNVFTMGTSGDFGSWTRTGYRLLGWSTDASASSGTINGLGNTTTFTVSRAGNGVISVKSSNTAVATASISGTTVTIKSVSKGTATITVSVAAGTNHNAPSNKTYSLTVTNIMYLYNNGTVTGLMAKQARMLEADAGRTLEPQWYFNSSSFTMTLGTASSGYTANGGTVYWTEPIDLTNYTTLRFEGSFSDDYNACRGVAVWSSMSGYIYGMVCRKVLKI